MAKYNDKFIVPDSFKAEYKRLTQLANRRVKSLHQHIEKTKPGNAVARAVLKGYGNKSNWASEKMPFSRSTKGYYITDADTGKQEFIKFRGQKDFERHLERLKGFAYDTEGKWSATEHVGGVLKDKAEHEKQVIIQGLNTTKNQYNITLPGGKLPQELIDEIESLTYNQLAHFWAGGDVNEDIEVSQMDSDDFIDISGGEGFVDTVQARIAVLKKYY